MAYYHPSNELLMRFSAGQQTNALGLMVACHLQNCMQCQQQASTFDRVGGDLLATLDPVAPPDDLLARTLARLDEPLQTPATPTQAKVNVSADLRLPKPLHRFVPGDFDQIPWAGMVSSIKKYVLPVSDHSYQAMLLKIAAGKELPRHTHRGNEYTLVMEGSFSDEAGEYRAGDFIATNTDTIHRPVAGRDKHCICFAVLDAPLKFTGILGTIINPFASRGWAR